jgi:hypothetical protein
MPRPLDTSIDAHRRQLDAYRSMEPAERLRLAAQMSAEVRALAESGIRRRHPDWSPDARAAELARILDRPPTMALPGSGHPKTDQ